MQAFWMMTMKRETQESGLTVHMRYSPVSYQNSWVASLILVYAVCKMQMTTACAHLGMYRS
jgi:hypothetical protein